MLAGSVRVTVAALTRVLRQHRLGVHPVLDVTPTFSDGAEDRAAEAAMWREFGELGLLDRRGRLDPGVLDTLLVLARPTVEYFGWFSSRFRDYGLLVAELGGDAVVAVRGAHAVRITPVDGESLPETVIRQLPPVRPARMRAVNIRRAELSGDSLPDSDVAAVRQLVAQAPTGLGELHVAVRDRLARRRITTEPVRYRDTRRGRVLVRLTDDYLSLAPADHRLLATRLRDAYEALIATA